MVCKYVVSRIAFSSKIVATKIRHLPPKKREKKRPLEASSYHYQLVKCFLGATVKGPYHWGSMPVTGKANGRFGDMGLLTATYHLDGGVQVRKSQLLKRSGACTWWRFSWVPR